MREIIFILFLFLLLLGCKRSNSSTEIYQDKRDNIVDVSDRIVSIPLEITVGLSKPYIVDKHLIVEDNQGIGKVIHLFRKDNFKYVASTGKIGQGPGELTTAAAALLPDSRNNCFFAMDLGKQKLYRFAVDSVINNERYLPKTQLNFTSLTNYLLRFTVLNDSIFIVKTGEIVNSNEFREEMGRLNINTGAVEKIGCQNSEIKTNRDTHSTIAFSKEHGMYINYYFYQDLLTICKTDGTLLFNVYGPGWGKNKKGELDFYSKGAIYKDKIIATYLGEQGIVLDKYKRPKSSLASKFLVFDLEGNYLKTLDTKHEIRSFCIDEENSRLIMYLFDAEEPLAHIDLKEILE